MRSTAVGVYVCLSTRVSQNPRVQTSRSSVHVMAVAVARSYSHDSAICCLLPVLWMTSYLAVIFQAKATPAGRILKKWLTGGAAPGAKSAAYDCLVWEEVHAGNVESQCDADEERIRAAMLVCQPPVIERRIVKPWITLIATAPSSTCLLYTSDAADE